ncbi:MAG: RluA family pseudouridine synthase [Pseudomonadales bacterium]|nr:RluA family pseudouridine synthase [Pseudomonadales bacterium]
MSGEQNQGERQTESPGVGVRLVEIAEEAGQRIDNFLLKTLKNVPRSHVYRILRRGEVRVNGGRIKPTYRLCAGDRVRIPPHRPGPSVEARELGAQQIRWVADAIIYEDADFIVLDKPAGLAVHGGSGVSFGVIEALRQLRNDPGLELGHRLDRDTSGCLIVARRRSALTGLHALLRAGAIDKRYTLLVYGHWPSDLNTVQQPLTRYLLASGERRVRIDPQGKASRTDFEVRARCRKATWLDAVLHTGRTHQIRVHAFASGHGVVGDPKYGDVVQQRLGTELDVDRLCLHAASIAFEWKGQPVRFECPLPVAMQQIWSRLEGSDQPSTATP